MEIEEFGTTYGIGRQHFKGIRFTEKVGLTDFLNIATVLENVTAAQDTIKAILDGAEKLEEFPFIGSIVEGLSFVSDEYRFLDMRNYLIFYRLTKPRIFIDRILYCKREHHTLLGLQ